MAPRRARVVLPGVGRHGRSVFGQPMQAVGGPGELALAKEVRSMRRLQAALWIAIAGLVVPATAFGQNVTADRVRGDLELTDRRIEQAATLVSAVADLKARSELDLARALQARARTAFDAGQYPMAGRLTMEARRHADRVIAFMRGLPDPDRVQAQLERTRDMLERASDRIQECVEDRARAMLHVAFDMQDRAENAALGSRYLGALQLTMGARERGLRALRLCRMEEDLQDAADRALRRTDQVLSRARERLESRFSGRPVPGPARDALARAVEAQDDARRQFRSEHYEASLRLTLSARSLAHRAVRLGNGAF